jgi:hypothetical protein
VTTDVDALQRTLAGEHAAVHAYGVLGGRAAEVDPASFRADLAQAYDAHVARRDDLRRLLVGLGADPVAAEPSYRLPPRLTTRRAISAEALRTEQACLEQYGALVAAVGPGATRTWAVAALGESARTTLAFGGEAQPLPGVTVTPS